MTTDRYLYLIVTYKLLIVTYKIFIVTYKFCPLALGNTKLYDLNLLDLVATCNYSS